MGESSAEGKRGRTTHQTSIQYEADGSVSLTRQDCAIPSKQAIADQEIRRMQQLLRDSPRRLALHLRKAPYLTLVAVSECGAEEEKDIAKTELERRRREGAAVKLKAEITSRMAKKKGD